MDNMKDFLAKFSSKALAAFALIALWSRGAIDSGNLEYAQTGLWVVGIAGAAYILGEALRRHGESTGGNKNGGGAS